MVIALIFAIAMNGFVYWKSDTLALKANGARELRPDELPRLRAIVADLARRAGIPVPRLYIIDRPEPNAFATGRDPEHSAVAVTTGILELMDDRQLAGVLAHELSHVKNRDTLVGTIAATIGGAISFIAQMAQFQMIFGGGRDDNRGGGSARSLRSSWPRSRRSSSSWRSRAVASTARTRRGPRSPGIRRRSPRPSSGWRQQTARTASGRACRVRCQDRAARLPSRRRRRTPPSPTSTSSIRCPVGASVASSRPTRRWPSVLSGCGRWLVAASAGRPELRGSLRAVPESISPRPARHGLIGVRRPRPARGGRGSGQADRGDRAARIRR